MTVKDRLDRCLVRTMGPPIERTMPTPTASLIDDMEMDSLDVVELVVNVEQEFKVTVTEEQGDKLVSWGDVIKLVNKLVKQEVDQREKIQAETLGPNLKQEVVDGATGRSTAAGV